MVNKKEICLECKRLLRTKGFVYNKLLKKRICKQCDKRIGNNKFYVPFKQKSNRVGNYNISELEKKRLWRKYVTQGYSYQIAWRKVYTFINGLSGVRRSVKRQRGKEMMDKTIKEKQRKEMKEKFVRGLK